MAWPDTAEFELADTLSSEGDHRWWEAWTKRYIYFITEKSKTAYWLVAYDKRISVDPDEDAGLVFGKKFKTLKKAIAYAEDHGGGFD